MSLLGNIGGTIQVHSNNKDTIKRDYSKDELLEALSELDKKIKELDQNKKPD